MKAFRFRLYPSTMQEKLLAADLNEARLLWNYLLDCVKIYYNATGKFLSRRELYFQMPKNALYSQVAQNQADRLAKAMRRFTRCRALGKRVSFPRFKKFGKMKSITYPQYGRGTELSKKLKLWEIGEISIKLHRPIDGKIKTVTIKRAPSGRWFAIFCVGGSSKEFISNNKPAAGLDFGLKKLVTLSNGLSFANPRFKRQELRVLRQRNRLFSKKKGGKNWIKAKIRLAKTHEKIVNKRKDYLHKVSRALVQNYGLIAMERLNVEDLKQGFLSNSFSDASLATLMRMLDYKAVSAGCRIIRVAPDFTTQICSSCGTRVVKELYERTHACGNCGLTLDRDVNAAINILKQATAGMAGSNAWENETMVSSMNQEAQVF